MILAGIGTAPVSFGVYGLADDGGVGADRLVEAMASCEYAGAELPPAGYAGPPGAAARLYAEHGLASVGIYIPIHFVDPEQQRVDEERMEEALDELVAAPTGPRLAILADEGDEVLLRHPARGEDTTHALSADAFSELTDSVNRLADRIRERGLEPSFHPHISTYVESPAEVEALLSATDVGLTFDTGHIALAGGDIIDRWRQWRDRINHVHLKDVRFSVLEEARATGRTDFDVWWAGVSAPLGEGDLDLEGFLRRMLADGYDGWIVVEQDHAPVDSPQAFEPIVHEQIRNLTWIRQAIVLSPTDKPDIRQPGGSRP